MSYFVCAPYFVCSGCSEEYALSHCCLHIPYAIMKLKVCIKNKSYMASITMGTLPGLTYHLPAFVSGPATTLL